MPYYVYILQSEIDQSFYKGFSEDVQKRLVQHNIGACHYTSSKMPWRLVYYEEHQSKREAIIREKNLKKAATARLKALIGSTKNLLTK